MSMQGNIGAATAAEEISTEVKKLIDIARTKNNVEAVELLEKVLALAVQIKKTADLGWY